MLLRCCLKDFEMFPVTFIITGITFVFYNPRALNFYFTVFVLQNIIIIILLMSLISLLCEFSRCNVSKSAPIFIA